MPEIQFYYCYKCLGVFMGTRFAPPTCAHGCGAKMMPVQVVKQDDGKVEIYTDE